MHARKKWGVKITVDYGTPCIIHLPESPPSPEVVDEVEGQRGDGDQGLSQQKVDVELDK